MNPIPATPEGDKTPASPEAHALVIKIIDAFLANFATTEEQMAQWVDDHVSHSRASLERRISALEGDKAKADSVVLSHIADLRRCSAMFRASTVAHIFENTSAEFDKAAAELSAIVSTPTPQ